MTDEDGLTYEDWNDLGFPEAVAVAEPEPEGEAVEVDALEILFEYAGHLVPGLRIDDRGLELPDSVTWDQASNLGELFTRLSASTPILWADVVNQAEVKFRENWTQLIADHLGKAEGTVRNWRFVAAQIPWEERPDLRDVHMSKLYEIAGLRTMTGKRLLIEMARDERLETIQVKTLCNLLKTYPDEERDGYETHWSEYAVRHGSDWNELSKLITEDLIGLGYMEDPDDQDVEEEPEKKTATETADDLLGKLEELAAELGQETPQNVVMLFVSAVRLSRVLAMSEASEEVDGAFMNLGLVAEHLAKLRKAQIDQGSSFVGCTCEIGEAGNLNVLIDCPVHGWEDEEEYEDPDPSSGLALEDTDPELFRYIEGLDEDGDQDYNTGEDEEGGRNMT